MAAQYFRKFEEMSVFTTQNFYNVCAAICSTKSYVAKRLAASFADTEPPFVLYVTPR